jgi:hypothetical protein
LNIVVDNVAKYRNEETFNLRTEFRALPQHLVNMLMQVRRKEGRKEAGRKIGRQEGMKEGRKEERSVLTVATL